MTSLPSLRKSIRTVIGSRNARASRRTSLRQDRNRVEGISEFFSLAGEVDHLRDEAPIFLLSAGWRSGSTLMQRLLSSGEKVMMWGEAYDHSSIIQNMADSLAPFSKDWPPASYLQPPDRIEDVARIWAANLYPSPKALVCAYRDCLHTLFAKPAHALGARHWGFKEVRFGHAEAVLLKGLFPNAKFLFIRRNLEDAYLSYAGFNPSQNWYGRWPHDTAFTPYTFARHWADMNRQFTPAVAQTGGILVDYEELIARRTDFDAIEAYLGFPLNLKVLENRIGSGTKSEDPVGVTMLEHWMLERGRRAGARRSGS